MIFRGAKDDVTALVLTRGESTIREAVNSLYHQTMPLRDIVMVRDVVPFHKAINAGAARVKTPFFVQVDADMILDAHCIAALRNAVRRDVGIVVGRLRDALIDQVVGVKLFRTQCFRTCSFRDFYLTGHRFRRRDRPGRLEDGVHRQGDAEQQRLVDDIR